MNPILVSQRLVKQESYGEIRACLDEAWGQFFDEVSALPVPLLTTTPAKSVWDSINPAALVLTGGNDLSSFSNDPLSQMRDNLERQHLEEALARDVPVFGICRGAQFIAEFFKSSLGPVTGHVATRHPITIQSKTIFGSLGESGRDVNSYHDYGILKVGDNLRELANAPDNSIEAFEHKRYPVVGIMWHPEREGTAGRVIERDILATMLNS